MLEYSLRGRVDKKLNLLGDILAKKQHNSPLGKGRWEAEINALVQNQRPLRRMWRKASEKERVGLKVLWCEVRQKLARLRRAERVRGGRKKRRRKELL